MTSTAASPSPAIQAPSVLTGYGRNKRFSDSVGRVVPPSAALVAPSLAMADLPSPISPKPLRGPIGC